MVQGGQNQRSLCAPSRRATVFGAATLTLSSQTSGCIRPNNSATMADSPSLSIRSPPRRAADCLTLISWNLGYAGLGANADFMADGGKNILPASRQGVMSNLTAILEQLSGVAADGILLQEIATSSLLTRGVDVHSAISSLYREWRTAFVLSTESRIPFGPLDVKVGNFSAIAFPSATFSSFDLPGDDALGLGILRRRYPVLVAHIPSNCAGPREWVIMNVHLSAFDASGHLRRTQLLAALKQAEQHYQAGRHVILGGDWNMRLSSKVFPHRTDERHLFWLIDFPFDILPPGWNLFVDDSAPTVRTLHAPYIVGTNYTTIIDGFLMSPNVSFRSARTLDLDFQNSDHNPVEICLTQC